MSVADGENRRTACTGKCPVPHPFLHKGIHGFMYADDLCVTAQQPSFVEVETTIEESLSERTQYYKSNNLRANPQKP